MPRPPNPVPEHATDVLIVGAGPIGIELAVALRRAGVPYEQLDAGQVGATIEWWAPQTRFFSSPERIEIAGVPLRCTGVAPTPGRETPVSVRQHDIELMTAPPAATENVVPATVVRQVFLGDSRDYMVELAGGMQLRVVTQAEHSVPPGSAVWLHLPPDRCRALAS